jgi:macrodomain Ter protein organizer (MatP/YcbG family)
MMDLDDLQQQLEQAIKHLYETRHQIGTRQRHKRIQQIATEWNVWMESAISHGNTGEDVSDLLRAILDVQGHKSFM